MPRFVAVSVILALTTGCSCDRMGLRNWLPGSNATYASCQPMCEGYQDGVLEGTPISGPSGTYEIAPPSTVIATPPPVTVQGSQPEEIIPGRSRLPPGGRYVPQN